MPPPKLLVFGIDGARADVMAGVARRPGSALGTLARTGGATFRAATAATTISGPAWASALSGAWEAKHRIRDNDFVDHRLDAYPHFMTRLRRLGRGWRTASVVHWAPINAHLLAPGDVDVAEDHPSDARVVARAAQLLRDDADLDALFVHLDEVDAWGHKVVYSPWSPLYVRAARRADAQLGTLLDAVAARRHRRDERWLVVVLSDHGGRWWGHARPSPASSTVPFVVAGDQVRPHALPDDTTVADLAPTCLHHLGVPPDPAWGLDGTVRGVG